MVDIIVIAVVALIIGSAAYYIYKAKKSGQKCIGCPAGSSCASQKKSDFSCGCSCGSHETH